jgi:cell wall-associated NlpC family hydrolase
LTQVGPQLHRSTETPSTDSQALASGLPVPAAFTKATPSRSRKSSFLSVAVTALVVPGIFATVALPAYAFQPVQDTTAVEASVALQTLKQTDAQSLSVASAASSSAAGRDGFTATTPEELAAEQARAAAAAAYAAYSGPTTADFLANPPYPNFDLAQVVNVALQYQGVPYAYGGSTPAGFDCSGFVAFVYAQFGIALPHSVSGQAAMGTPISVDAALPGDIVTMPGHNGIYLGGGMFIDAPDYGGVVSVRAIWTSDYYIYRLGI